MRGAITTAPMDGRCSRRYFFGRIDEVMLQEGAAKLAAFTEGKVLGKVKGATEIAPL